MAEPGQVWAAAPATATRAGTVPSPLHFLISWNYFAIRHSQTEIVPEPGRRSEAGWVGNTRSPQGQGGGGGSSFASAGVKVLPSLGLVLVL